MALAAAGAATLLSVLWTERGKLFGAGPALVRER
jgi:hypothetical protein